MTTFVRNGETYTIVYIDPSIANAGDGSTSATALKDFPSSLENNKCYLVRRCDGTVSANWATSQSSVTNIMVISMPISGDDFYDLIDNDTKAAWDNDLGEYGIITKSSSSYPQMTYAKQVLFNGIYFNKTYNSMGSWFSVGNDSNTANAFTVSNCKFGTMDCPLDDDTWIASNEPTSTQLKYFYCYNNIYSKNVFIKGNIINIAAYSNSSDYSLFCIRRAINCEIFDNVIRSICSNYENNMKNCSIFKFYSCYNNIKVLQNSIEYLIRPNNAPLGLQGLLYFGSSYISNLLIERINIDSVPMNGGSVNAGSSSSYSDEHLIYVSCSSHYTSIKNIYADFNTNAGAKLASAEVLKYVPAVSSDIKQLEIDNININLCEDLTMSVTNNRDVYKTAFVLLNSGIGGNNIIANNINVIAPHMNALELQNCGAINIGNVKGNIQCCSDSDSSNYTTVINIDALESLYPDTKCIKIISNNYYLNQLLLHIGTLNVVNNTATPTIPQVHYTDNFNGTTVFIDNSNALLYTDADWDISLDYGDDIDTAIICPNCVVSGQYYSMMSAGSIKSSSAYRTGSSNTASLRFNRTNNSSSSVCSVGQSPYKGIMITPSSTGEHTLKIYFATVGSHDASTFLSNFVVTAYVRETFEDTEYICTHTSNTNGNIKTDTSTWNGISDYTAYVVELPIYCYDTTPVEVKIDDLYYNEGFNVYLDTDIVLE